MNHSIEVIREYVCLYYGISLDRLLSPLRDGKLVKARQMILLLAGSQRDSKVAKCLNRSRVTQVCVRKTVIGNMKYNKSLRKEFETLKKGLMIYEISDLIIN